MIGKIFSTVVKLAPMIEKWVRRKCFFSNSNCLEISPAMGKFIIFG